MVTDVVDKDFEQEVIGSNLPALVDMWAPWCGPCRMIAPVVDKLAEKYDGKLRFFRLNIDENPLTPARYRVMSISASPEGPRPAARGLGGSPRYNSYPLPGQEGGDLEESSRRWSKGSFIGVLAHRDPGRWPARAT